MSEHALVAGRPALPVGTFGKVAFVVLPSGAIQARARFRDYDGRQRLVSRTGPTRPAADTRVSDLADAWLASAEGWSTGTARTYRSMVRTQIKPALGDLRLREVNSGVVSIGGLGWPRQTRENRGAAGR